MSSHTKQVASGLEQMYHVTILLHQLPAVVKFTQSPYREEVHVECANQHLAPELLGVYPMPGGFNQVQSLAQNSNACSISSRLQRWSRGSPCVTTLEFSAAAECIHADNAVTNLLGVRLPASALCCL